MDPLPYGLIDELFTLLEPHVTKHLMLHFYLFRGQEDTQGNVIKPISKEDLRGTHEFIFGNINQCPQYMFFFKSNYNLLSPLKTLPTKLILEGLLPNLEVLNIPLIDEGLGGDLRDFGQKLIEMKKLKKLSISGLTKQQGVSNRPKHPPSVLLKNLFPLVVDSDSDSDDDSSDSDSDDDSSDSDSDSDDDSSDSDSDDDSDCDNHIDRDDTSPNNTNIDPDNNNPNITNNNSDTDTNQNSDSDIDSPIKIPFYNLEVLELGENSMGFDGIQYLSTNALPFLPNLTTLNLSSNNITDDLTIQLLLDWIHEDNMPMLISLDLSGNNIRTKTGVVMLSQNSIFSRLKSFYLNNVVFLQRFPGIFFQSSTFSSNNNLEYLHLVNTKIVPTDRDFILHKIPGLCNLKEFNTIGSEFLQTNQDVKTLCNAPYLNNLEYFDLSALNNTMDTLTFQIIVQSSNITKLKSLLSSSLSTLPSPTSRGEIISEVNFNFSNVKLHGRFSSRGLRYLAQSPYIPPFGHGLTIVQWPYRHVDTSYHCLDHNGENYTEDWDEMQRRADDDFHFFIHSDKVKGLKSLDFYRVNLSTNAIISISSSPNLNQLEYLDIAPMEDFECDPDIYIPHLLNSSNLINVQLLVLRDAGLDDDHLDYFIHSTVLNNMKWIDLESNRFTIEGIERVKTLRPSLFKVMRF